MTDSVVTPPRQVPKKTYGRKPVQPPLETSSPVRALKFGQHTNWRDDIHKLDLAVEDQENSPVHDGMTDLEKYREMRKAVKLKEEREKYAAQMTATAAEDYEEPPSSQGKQSPYLKKTSKTHEYARNMRIQAEQRHGDAIAMQVDEARSNSDRDEASHTDDGDPAMQRDIDEPSRGQSSSSLTPLESSSHPDQPRNTTPHSNPTDLPADSEIFSPVIPTGKSKRRLQIESDAEEDGDATIRPGSPSSSRSSSPLPELSNIDTSNSRSKRPSHSTSISASRKQRGSGTDDASDASSLGHANAALNDASLSSSDAEGPASPSRYKVRKSKKTAIASDSSSDDERSQSKGKGRQKLRVSLRGPVFCLKTLSADACCIFTASQ